MVSRDRRFEAAAQRCCSCWLQAVHRYLRDRPFSGVKMVQIRHNASSDRELCVRGDGERRGPWFRLQESTETDRGPRVQVSSAYCEKPATDDDCLESGL